MTYPFSLATSEDEPSEAAGNDLSSSLEPNSKDFLPQSIDEIFHGKLLVLEGPEGSGRSTQMLLLAEWLEWKGFAVQTVGLKRSKLLAKDLHALTRSNDLQPLTRMLLYATDFYDQVEHQLIPALRSGFIILADRYTLTLTCRAAARGMDHPYLDNLYRYAPTPDLAIRMDLEPDLAFQRMFESKSALNLWEFGGDLHLADNIYDSFCQYQNLMRDLMRERGEPRNYNVVNAAGSVAKVNEELRGQIAECLGIQDISYKPSKKLKSIYWLS